MLDFKQVISFGIMNTHHTQGILQRWQLIEHTSARQRFGKGGGGGGGGGGGRGEEDTSRCLLGLMTEGVITKHKLWVMSAEFPELSLLVRQYYIV